ncbi:MAG: hypothetical protein AAGJ35_09545, partial [Myxococcota bacterium]
SAPLSHPTQSILFRIQQLFQGLKTRVHALSKIPVRNLFQQLQHQLAPLPHTQLQCKDHDLSVEIYQAEPITEMLRILVQSILHHPPHATLQTAPRCLKLSASCQTNEPPHKSLIFHLEDDGCGWLSNIDLSTQPHLDSHTFLQLLQQRQTQNHPPELTHLADHLKTLDATIQCDLSQVQVTTLRIHLPIPNSYLYGKHIAHQGMHFFIPASMIRDIIPAQEALTTHHSNGKRALKYTQEEQILGIAPLPLPPNPHDDAPSANDTLPTLNTINEVNTLQSYIVLEADQGLVAIYADELYDEQFAELIFVGSSFLQDPRISGGAMLESSQHVWLLAPQKLYQSYHLPPHLVPT